MVLLAAAAGEAPALGPEEVLVVANSASPDSLALAKFYMQHRAIPERNLCTVKADLTYYTTFLDYESQVRQPVRKFLIQSDPGRTIRCLVLTYGVPTSIIARGGADRIFLKDYQTAATKAHYRLAINYELLGTVCRLFPEPRAAGLEPLGQLFPSPMPEPRQPLVPVEELNKNISVLLKVRQKQLAEILDPFKRQIASRQLMALHLDLYGLSGLAENIASARSEGAPDLADIRRQLSAAQEELAALKKQPLTKETLAGQLRLMERIDGVSVAGGFLQQKLAEVESMEIASAVDSELALLWWDDYPQANWLGNPLHWRVPAADRRKAPPVVMVSRIDGPSLADAERMITNGLAAEKTGLRGVFYLDAGGSSQIKGAGAYEETFRKLYRLLRQQTKLKAVLDEKPEVFPPGSCPDAALYVGWYSLRTYVPAFTWVPGAVGWHVASFEAENIRDPNATRWCVKMIQNGVAATIGAESEPTLGAFPLPEDFFPLLLTGKWTVAECYWRTTPMVSWRILLLADPLYNPFLNAPQLAVTALPQGLAP